jgi:4'-phosphopantetheinyl transferase
MNATIPISPGEIHLWLAPYEEIADERVHAGYRQLLSSAERCRAATHFARDRRYLVTRALLRTVLSRCVRAARGVDFVTNAYGRPEAVNAPAREARLSFNLSHTHSLIVLGVTTRGELGVDVENIRARDVSIGVADRYFAPQEVRVLNAAPAHEQQYRFFEYWTFKESYIKARGMGLSLPLDKFSFRYPDDQAVEIAIDPALADDVARWQFWQFQPAPEYLVAVYAERTTAAPPRLIERKTVPMLSEIPTRNFGFPPTCRQARTTTTEVLNDRFYLSWSGFTETRNGADFRRGARICGGRRKWMPFGYSMRKLCLEDTENRLKGRSTRSRVSAVNALHYYKAIGEGSCPSWLGATAWANTMPHSPRACSISPGCGW